MSAAEELWQELLTSALLGTERRMLALPASSGKLSNLLNQKEAKRQAEQLFQSLLRRAFAGEL